MAASSDAPTGADPVRMHLRSDEPDEVVDAIHRFYEGYRLTVKTPADRSYRVSLEAAGDERFIHQHVDLTVGGVGAGALEDMTAVGIVRSGEFGMEVGRQALDTRRPYLTAEQGYVADFSGLDLDLVAVRTTDLHAAARRITGDERHRLRFTGWTPADEAAERYWRSVERHLATTTADPALLSSPLVRGELFRTAVRAMLLAFPNTALAAEHRSPGPVPRRDAELAAQFIVANAEQDIGIDEIAAAAGAPARSLSAVFRRSFGVTPLQYLRRERLDRARAELAAAEPWGTVTVAGVARRWGFLAPGRFAGEYRRRFGESPSATLRR